MRTATPKTGSARDRPLSVRAAVLAGILAGLLFLLLEMLMVSRLDDGSLWGPPRMIAAIILGQEALPPPATFVLIPMLVAFFLHLLLSVLYALGLAFVIQHLGFESALLVGAAVGLLLYFLNFYLFTALFPWFANARNWITIFAHLAFGIAAAWSYKSATAPSTAPD